MRIARSWLLATGLCLASGVAAFFAGTTIGGETAAPSEVVYELRTYTMAPGRLDAINARFRDHTMRLFEKHGIKNIAYWVPTDEPLSKNTLVYIIEHNSRDAAKKAWDAFRVDPEWKKVKAESEKDGPIVTSVKSVYMSPTDYSPKLK